MGKDFYDTKFGNKTFSANKIKELIKKYFEIISEIDEDKDTIFILR